MISPTSCSSSPSTPLHQEQHKHCTSMHHCVYVTLCATCSSVLPCGADWRVYVQAMYAARRKKTRQQKISHATGFPWQSKSKPASLSRSKHSLTISGRCIMSSTVSKYASRGSVSPKIKFNNKHAPTHCTFRRGNSPERRLAQTSRYTHACTHIYTCICMYICSFYAHSHTCIQKNIHTYTHTILGVPPPTEAKVGLLTSDSPNQSRPTRGGDRSSRWIRQASTRRQGTSVGGKRETTEDHTGSKPPTRERERKGDPPEPLEFFTVLPNDGVCLPPSAVGQGPQKERGREIQNT